MGKQGPATIEDLYHIEGQAEIVDGKIVRLPFHTIGVGRAIGELKMNLRGYSCKKGSVMGSTVAYVVALPHRKAFCPDLAY
jgi:hypothetical protein